MGYKINCRFFRGDIPCAPHKKEGVHCAGCRFYQPISKEILIIKLGAAGDVIRTTPLLHRLRKVYPKARITWLTEFPDLVPRAFVDKIVDFRSPDTFFLLAAEFDLVYSLDKDYSATSLAALVKAKSKKGYILSKNHPAPIDRDAEHKYFTGIFDDICLKNRKHYVEEIFEICGFNFNREKYILELASQRPALPAFTKPVVGLNTGCGSRWQTRLWPEESWVKLAVLLKKKGYTPLLLGGPQEDQLNRRIAKKSGAQYLGTFKLNDFIHEVNLCDLVITQVTMGLHIAIGLNKKIILMNNIFNRYEFYLYDLGKIVEPPKKCLGCYKNSCPDECMSLISPEQISRMAAAALK